MSWKKVKLGDLIENFSIKANTVDDFESFCFWGVSNEDGIVPTKNAAIEKAAEYKIIEKGCFAYNPYRINVGSIGFYEEGEKGLISPAYVVFKIKNNSIYHKLLLDFLKSKEGLFQIKMHARGTVRQALRFEDLCQIELSLPSIQEQSILYENVNRVSNIISIFDKEQANQLDLIKKLRQQILKDAIQGKLVEQNSEDEPASELIKKIKAEKERLIKEKKIKKDILLTSILADEKPFEIPENWIWCRLGEFCYIASGSTPKQDAFVNEGVPYLKMYNIRDQKIDFEHKSQYIKREIHEGILKRSRTSVGDVLMNIVGPPLGKVAIIPNRLIEANFNQAGVLIRPFLFKNSGLNYWIYWYLNEMSEINSISTKGVAGQDNISVTQSKNIKIPLPPLAEQQRIVKRVDKLMELCDQLEKSVIQNQEITEKLYQSALKEVLQPKSTKKISLSPDYCGLPERTILAGYILNQCYTEDIGRVKFMKLLYLVEHTCYLDFNSQYIVKAAGPYDEKLIKEVEQKLSQMSFYQIKQDRMDNKRVHYTQLGSAPELDSLFNAHFANKKEAIDQLLSNFKKSTWEQCEIVATLYAVWNNRILKKELVNDALLKQDFLDWDKNKAKYKNRLDEALTWMRNNEIIPTGYGKLIEKPMPYAE